jgi:hypothetical protein
MHSSTLIESGAVYVTGQQRDLQEDRKALEVGYSGVKPCRLGRDGGYDWCGARRHLDPFLCG